MTRNSQEKPTTEQSSEFDDIETMTTEEIVSGINGEDKKVAAAVAQSTPQITALIDQITPKMVTGGRLFYIGAGTSGRLGIVDASECPPTFGVSPDKVIGLIAGGDTAIRTAVEGAEDNPELAIKDLNSYEITNQDSVIGIAASGRTPYVVGGIKHARELGCVTGCITCNHDTDLANAAEFPVEVIVGPEFITGSTRMKAGTAQKMVLNMVSTTLMVKLGHVEGNRMVDMALSNRKLIERGTRMVMEKTGLPADKAEALLQEHGSVRKASESHSKG